MQFRPLSGPHPGRLDQAFPSRRRTPRQYARRANLTGAEVANSRITVPFPATGVSGYLLLVGPDSLRLRELHGNRIVFGREVSLAGVTSVEHETVAAEFTKYFDLFAARAATLTAPLTEEQFWARPYPYGNSVGHLLLHVTGNLNYCIGARIAGTGYVRDREREFTDPTHPKKEDVLRSLDDAVAMVKQTLESQTAVDWSREYSAVGVDDKTRFGIVLRCAQHFHHHLGQIIYLVKEHTR